MHPLSIQNPNESQGKCFLWRVLVIIVCHYQAKRKGERNKKENESRDKNAHYLHERCKKPSQLTPLLHCELAFTRTPQFVNVGSNHLFIFNDSSTPLFFQKMAQKWCFRAGDWKVRIYYSALKSYHLLKTPEKICTYIPLSTSKHSWWRSNACKHKRTSSQKICNMNAQFFGTVSPSSLRVEDRDRS